MERPTSKTTERLPHAITTLVGREDERIDIAARLRSSRLLTLLGSGGMGKTRLATETARDVAAEYPDGVWFVGLEAITEDRLVVTELAAALEIPEEAGRSMLQSVRRVLCDKRALLVLDNCEHLIAASAELVGALLRDCGDLRILATSREPLGVPGERIWVVPPLAVPNPEGLPEGRTTLLRVLQGYEGIRLFVERAQAAQPDFEVTAENARAVATICARMEGVPLAIELAAARLRTLSAEGVAERLGDSLRLLATTRGTPTKRQQTLRATIDWSYSLLGADEQTLMRHLAVFASGWTVEAAEAVGGTDAVDILASLVDKSLVAFEERRDRYRYLETVRQYANERLDLSGERNEIDARFRAWAIGLGKDSFQGLLGTEQADWAKRLDAESDNLRAALDGCEDSPEEGLTLAASLTYFWQFRQRYSEGRERLDQALGRIGAGAATMARAKALKGAGILAYGQTDYDGAQAYYERCLALCAELNDELETMSVKANLGIVAFYRHDIHLSNSYFEETLPYWRSVDNKHAVASILMNLGINHNVLGNLATAHDYLEGALCVRRSMGDERGVAWVLVSQGKAAYFMGDYGRARALFDEALSSFRESEGHSGVAETLLHLVPILVELGHDQSVFDLMDEASEISLKLGNVVNVRSADVMRGFEMLRRSDSRTAKVLFEKALEYEANDFFAEVCVDARLGLGQIALAEMRRGEAHAHFLEARRLTGKSNSPRKLASVFEGFSALSLALEDAESGARFLGAAEALRSKFGPPIATSARTEQTGIKQRLKTRLGEEAFATAWEKGRSSDWRDLASPVLS